MARNGCVDCGNDTIPIFWRNTNGEPIYPPVTPDGIEIPNPETSPDFNATASAGITVTPGGTQGHEPTIAVNVCPDPTNALTVTAAGCLYANAGGSGGTGTFDWSTPNQAQTIQGVRVIQGVGETYTFAVVPSPEGSCTVGFDGQGRLQVDGCDGATFDETPWFASTGENVVIVAGDNPAGDAGNGHRPTIGTRRGSGLCPPLEFRCVLNGDGTANVSIFNPNSGGSIPLGGPF